VSLLTLVRIGAIRDTSSERNTGDAMNDSNSMAAYRQTSDDAQGRARFLLRWQDGAQVRGQYWFGTVAGLRSMLSRNGFVGVEVI
jgi:hypothetical protein